MRSTTRRRRLLGIFASVPCLPSLYSAFLRESLVRLTGTRVRVQFSSTRPEEPKYVHYALLARGLVRDPASKFF
ncbi:hypothetical protein F5B21DRAFT_451171 [Xylaria acuta]|nr:hypothetical protein F5B21DRAFT_451171 [Xylaria acuta]